MMSDDGPYPYYVRRGRDSIYAGYGWEDVGWTSSRDELTEKEIEGAKSSPYPADLLTSVLARQSGEAIRAIADAGYTSRVLRRDGNDVVKYHSGVLERKRINLHLVDEIVVLAYVG